MGQEGRVGSSRRGTAQGSAERNCYAESGAYLVFKRAFGSERVNDFMRPAHINAYKASAKLFF